MADFDFDGEDASSGSGFTIPVPTDADLEKMISSARATYLDPKALADRGPKKAPNQFILFRGAYQTLLGSGVHKDDVRSQIGSLWMREIPENWKTCWQRLWEEIKNAQGQVRRGTSGTPPSDSPSPLAHEKRQKKQRRVLRGIPMSTAEHSRPSPGGMTVARHHPYAPPASGSAFGTATSFRTNGKRSTSTTPYAPSISPASSRVPPPPSHVVVAADLALPFLPLRTESLVELVDRTDKDQDRLMAAERAFQAYKLDLQRQANENCTKRNGKLPTTASGRNVTPAWIPPKISLEEPAARPSFSQCSSSGSSGASYYLATASDLQSNFGYATIGDTTLQQQALPTPQPVPAPGMMPDVQVYKPAMLDKSLAQLSRGSNRVQAPSAMQPPFPQYSGPFTQASFTMPQTSLPLPLFSQPLRIPFPRSQEFLQLPQNAFESRPFAGPSAPLGPSVEAFNPYIHLVPQMTCMHPTRTANPAFNDLSSMRLAALSGSPPMPPTFPDMPQSHMNTSSETSLVNDALAPSGSAEYHPAQPTGLDRYAPEFTPSLYDSGCVNSAEFGGMFESLEGEQRADAQPLTDDAQAMWDLYINPTGGDIYP
ncbi:uncharacterized protein BXZ73DRAFT_103109 [Epithele typhae]|uniref:uncharacterized protein n=1 Tax=Epithele typhae TaxID=378194 RepID=UPI0020073762|nr:uncharacterized protein BXZ73DRAFT_103109 [Epithele typhae]KAH9925945.1 hypothetical protein BXZ73DRAFT_103109 [Epithele typhae]